MRKPIVAGNWKMHGTLDSARTLAGEVVAESARHAGVEVVVIPPFVHLQAVQAAIEGSCVQLGAQDVSPREEGAHTGEVSTRMLRDVGCRYVLCGHSERRQYQSESNELVAQKFMAARRAGLLPVLCVGESFEERERGETETVLRAQLEPVLRLGGPATFEKALLAYEPRWAIGTGRTATPEQAQQAHRFLRSEVAAFSATIADLVPLLYGGSVKAANAAELFAQPDVDGGLIGGASLIASEFMGIVAAATVRT
jgi:triosephosphate isomerase